MSYLLSNQHKCNQNDNVTKCGMGKFVTSGVNIQCLLKYRLTRLFAQAEEIQVLEFLRELLLKPGSIKRSRKLISSFLVTKCIFRDTVSVLRAYII